MREHVEEKIADALRVFEVQPMSCDVVLRVDKNLSNPDRKTCEVTVFVRDSVVRVTASASDMNAAIDWCKAAGIKKINVMTNDDIMAQRKAEVRAQKDQKDQKDQKADETAKAKPAREKLVVDTDKPATDYVVKDGDTLSSLAKTFYHDGAEWEIIFDANKETLNGKPNFLKIGTKLVIPAVKKVTVSPK
jgi:putative sigma-54 modulation protein